MMVVYHDLHMITMIIIIVKAMMAITLFAHSAEFLELVVTDVGSPSQARHRYSLHEIALILLLLRLTQPKTTIKKNQQVRGVKKTQRECYIPTSPPSRKGCLVDGSND